MAQDLYLVMASLVMGAVMLIVGNLLADLLLKAVDPELGWKILTSGKLTGFNVCFRKFITSSAPEPTVVISWHIPTKCWTR